MTNLVINIGVNQALYIIYAIIALIVVVSGILIKIAWSASGRFTGIESDIKNLGGRITNLEGGGIFRRASPLSLSDIGKTLLAESGLKDYIDAHKNDLIKECGNSQKMETAYDIQKATFAFFDIFQFEKPLEDKMKEAAFGSGYTMDVMRRIAGIYFRDICLGYHKKDIKEIKDN